MKFFTVGMSSFSCVLLLAALLSAPALAQVACETPHTELDVTVDADFEYCNMYIRQFAHREAMTALHEQLVERQKNYIKPSLEMREQYQKDLKAFYERQDKQPDDEPREPGADP